MGFFDDIKEEIYGKKYYADESVRLSLSEIENIAQEYIDKITNKLSEEERKQSVEILNGKQEIYWVEVFSFYKCDGQNKDFLNFECKQSGSTQTGRCFLNNDGKEIIRKIQNHFISEGIKCVLMSQLDWSDTDYKEVDLDEPYKFRIKTTEYYNKKPRIRYLLKCIKTVSASNKALSSSEYLDLEKYISLYKNDEDILKLARFAWESKAVSVLRSIRSSFSRQINEGKEINRDVYLSYDDKSICGVAYAHVGIAPINDKIKLKALANVVFEYINTKTLEELSDFPELSVSFKYCKVYYAPDCSSTSGGVKIGEADALWLKTQERNKQGVRPPGYISPTVYDGACFQIRNTYTVKQLRQL